MFLHLMIILRMSEVNYLERKKWTENCIKRYQKPKARVSQSSKKRFRCRYTDHLKAVTTTITGNLYHPNYPLKWINDRKGTGKDALVLYLFPVNVTPKFAKSTTIAHIIHWKDLTFQFLGINRISKKFKYPLKWSTYVLIHL